MITGMIGLILVNGLGFFWPKPLTQLTLADGTTLLGEIVGARGDSDARHPEHRRDHRIQIKVGNRDLSGADFRWIDESEIKSRSLPRDAIYVERREYGPFIGTPFASDRGRDGSWRGSRCRLAGAAAADREGGRRSRADPRHRARRDRRDQRRDRSGAAGAAGGRAARAQGRAASGRRGGAASERRLAELQSAVRARPRRASPKWSRRPRARASTLAAADGTEKDLATLDIFRAYRGQRALVRRPRRRLCRPLWEFLSGDPRESNTEGGIFPAIFGTVMMVILMSLLAVPFGVLAALYLRDTRDRACSCGSSASRVNNLAGVPSIVFGVFGLGFFVYFVGGSIDQAFYRRTPADADVRHRRHPLGVADARTAHRAGGHRRLRRGAGGRAALDARGVARHRARRSSRRSCASCCRPPRQASSPASSSPWRAARARSRR